MCQSMNLAFLTGSARDIEKAARLGFDGVELSAGAFGTPGTGDLDAASIEAARALCGSHNMVITALAYYDLAFNAPPEDRITAAYARVFDAAERLGVRVIASMSGL